MIDDIVPIIFHVALYMVLHMVLLPQARHDDHKFINHSQHNQLINGWSHENDQFEVNTTNLRGFLKLWLADRWIQPIKAFKPLKLTGFSNFLSIWSNFLASPFGSDGTTSYSYWVTLQSFLIAEVLLLQAPHGKQLHQSSSCGAADSNLTSLILSYHSSVAALTKCSLSRFPYRVCPYRHRFESRCLLIHAELEKLDWYLSFKFSNIQ